MDDIYTHLKATDFLYLKRHKTAAMHWKQVSYEGFYNTWQVLQKSFKIAILHSENSFYGFWRGQVPL